MEMPDFSTLQLLIGSVAIPLAAWLWRQIQLGYRAIEQRGAARAEAKAAKAAATAAMDAKNRELSDLQSALAEVQTERDELRVFASRVVNEDIPNYNQRLDQRAATIDKLADSYKILAERMAVDS